MNIKHNKKRNTAFLYEILVREVAKATYDKDEKYKKSVMDILMKYFQKESVLTKDYQCYKPLYETKNMSKSVADRLISEMYGRRSKINKKTLFNAQTKLINEINKTLSDEIWSNFVPEYRFMGTLYQYFYGDELPAKTKVILEENIAKRLTTPSKRENDLVEPVDSITYNIYVEKFNKHYGKVLNEHQKKTVKNFIFSINDGGTSFKTFLAEEIKRLKGELKTTCEGNMICDLEINKKIAKVGELLESYSKKQVPLDEMVPKILKIQDLLEEMKSEESNDVES